jgi:hypothetical protein
MLACTAAQLVELLWVLQSHHGVHPVLMARQLIQQPHNTYAEERISACLLSRSFTSTVEASGPRASQWGIHSCVIKTSA